jgi:nucleotide-binding universal stress UspA family protein
MNGGLKNSVVVPVDFSAESKSAVDTALGLVKSPSRLHVIHVLPQRPAVEPGLGWTPEDDQFRRQQAEDQLRRWLADPQYQGLDLVVALGDPGQQIADFAQSILAEMIVLPSHGRTGLARLLIGSVAEKVVRLARCPVLVLKQGPTLRT